MHPILGMVARSILAVQCRQLGKWQRLPQAIRCAWWLGLNEVDKGSIAVNDKVAIEVDAMPGKNLQGVVSHIVPQSETREAWGTAAYFKVEIEFDDHNMATALALVPGMSVLVEKLP